MDVRIELRPHIGHRNTPLGPVAVEHDQWIVVLVRGTLKRQVGYQRKALGAPLLWLGGRIEAAKEWGLLLVEAAERQCAKEVNALLGESDGSES